VESRNGWEIPGSFEILVAAIKITVVCRSRYCFAAAVVQSCTDDDLPMPFSAFYSQHMIKHCRGDTKLDFKQSAYKKIAKFAKEMAKKKMCAIKVSAKIDPTHMWHASAPTFAWPRALLGGQTALPLHLPHARPAPSRPTPLLS
jgi:hypothetical protein